jgi:ribose 5-phosphate isomerase B
MKAPQPKWRLGLGADDVGASLKEYLLSNLENDPRLASIHDFGEDRENESRPYPVMAIRVGEAIVRGDIDRAVLICGTGIGMCIAANKVPGIRAAVVHDDYSAERSVLSNNCQIMTLGSRIIANVYAHRLVSEWLGYQFDPRSASAAKLEIIEEFEDQLGAQRRASHSRGAGQLQSGTNATPHQHEIPRSTSRRRG